MKKRNDYITNTVPVMPSRLLATLSLIPFIAYFIFHITPSALNPVLWTTPNDLPKLIGNNFQLI
jgi:hypothetical protein